jgi:hypothetical protein
MRPGDSNNVKTLWQRGIRIKRQQDTGAVRWWSSEEGILTLDIKAMKQCSREVRQ